VRCLCSKFYGLNLYLLLASTDFVDQALNFSAQNDSLKLEISQLNLSSLFRIGLDREERFRSMTNLGSFVPSSAHKFFRIISDLL
jgi:hypothetical protein